MVVLGKVRSVGLFLELMVQLQLLEVLHTMVVDALTQINVMKLVCLTHMEMVGMALP